MRATFSIMGVAASSIMKCNTWESRKGDATIASSKSCWVRNEGQVLNLWVRNEGQVLNLDIVLSDKGKSQKTRPDPVTRENLPFDPESPFVPLPPANIMPFILYLPPLYRP